MLCPEVGKTENSVVVASNFKRHQPPFSDIVNLSETFQIYMKQDEQSFGMTVSRAQPVISYMVYLIIVDMNFS